MKKWYSVFIVFVFIILAGCSSDSSSAPTLSSITGLDAVEEGISKEVSTRFVRTEWSRHRSIGNATNFNYIITDKKYNVQYLVVTTSINRYESGISVTPLIDENGKPVLNKDLE